MKKPNSSRANACHAKQPQAGDVATGRDYKYSNFVALLLIALVIALLVGGSYAYLNWTTDQTPNRVGAGIIEFHIVESTDGTTAEKVDQDATFTAGAENNKVKFRAGDSEKVGDARIRVSFMPQVGSSEVDGTNVLFGENWSEPSTDGTGTFISTDILKLYINPSYADFWDYSDGTFTTKEAVAGGEETPVLLYGATLADGKDSGDYSSVKVNVIASAIQANATGAW